MGYYNLEEEKNVHPYKYYGKIKEEVHDNANYLLKSALSYVIDDYDEYLGSIELSHYEDLGYYELTNFHMQYLSDTLDLSWMNSDDVFVLPNDDQILSIRNLIVNIDNLGYSSLPTAANQITLTVNSSNSKLSAIQQIKGFKSFLEKNGSKLTGVKLVGFNQLMESILSVYVKREGLEVLHDEQRRLYK